MNRMEELSPLAVYSHLPHDSGIERKPAGLMGSLQLTGEGNGIWRVFDFQTH